ncbi:MAG: TetR/AcrR family transcriptional regulator [Bacteroidales bacterium]|nr:TetR/AcrR family transcriptional regulator [Bacteroidales bacterium]
MSEEKRTEKETQILRTGKKLFWKYGIKKVSIEEICKQAQVSKMTFYKYFQNKRDLVLAILDETVGSALKDYKDLIEKECPFTDKINEMLKMKLEGTNDISKEFMLDIYQNADLGLLPYIEEQSKSSLQLTIGFLKDAQKNGQIRQDIKIDFILYYFNQMISMTTDELLLEKYKTPQDLIMEAMEFFFYGIGAKQFNQ